MALPWQIWLTWLMAANFGAVWLLRDEPTGWFILAAMCLGLVIGTELFRRQGFTRLLGLMHLPWIPMTFAILLRWRVAPSQGLLGSWLLAAFVTNVLCLTIDTVDVIRYLRGDRAAWPDPVPPASSETDV